VSRSALGRVVDLLAGPSERELSELAFELRNNAASLSNHLSSLCTRPVTLADFLLNRVDHGISFEHYDALLARADRVLRSAPNAMYIELGSPFPLSGCVEALRSAVVEAEPYRKVPRGGAR